MVYTGYLYEVIISKKDLNSGWSKLLEVADILVDGPFIEAEKDYLLKFRGSKNQRIIDLNKTRLTGTVVLTDI
jgi:anaerobic ribonucleoside-triphosphate reductase activating protein